PGVRLPTLLVTGSTTKPKISLRRSHIERRIVRFSTDCQPDQIYDRDRRIWPGDIALTLGWSSITVFEVSEIDDEFCSHALVDKTGGSRVRVIEASKDWPVQKVRQSMKKG